MKANASRIAVYVKHDIVFQIQPSISIYFPPCRPIFVYRQMKNIKIPEQNREKFKVGKHVAMCVIRTQNESECECMGAYFSFFFFLFCLFELLPVRQRALAFCSPFAEFSAAGAKNWFRKTHL